MVKLLVKSKKKKNANTGAQFRTYFTDVEIVVKGEESKGLQRKTIDVRFDKTVDTKNIVRGLITCNEEDIVMPYKWQIVTKDNGKESYPSVFIKKVLDYEEQRGKSTIRFITEEDETSETVIDDEEVEVTEESEED